MCKSKEEGGQRCECPPEQRRAQRRAKYAADKLASAPVEGAPVPSGQMSDEEMANRFSYQLVALHQVWEDRDPAYAKRLKTAAQDQAMLEALRGDTYSVPGVQSDNSGDTDALTDKGLKDLWAVNVEMSRYKVSRDVQDLDGNKVEWSPEGWEQIDHTVQSVSEDGENWRMEGAGTLHNPETGQWLAYRWNDAKEGRETFTEARVAGDLAEAAGFLSTKKRAELGLPEPRPQAIETAEIPKATQAEMMKDLRRQLVGDDASPDAGLEFAAQMAAMRLEAVGRGASTDHKWSMANRVMAQMEAARRGASIAGWMGGSRQWEAQGRVLKPGAEPYEIWAPVIKGDKADKDDETKGAEAGGDTAEAPAPGRRFTKKTTDGKTLVGFRAIKVYDWTQTVRADGQPDPDWKATVPGGSQELLERLKASSPHPIEYDHGGNTTGHAHGWTDGRKIVLDPHKGTGNQISTLAHEMTHAELDHVGRIARGEITREEAEQEAQLGAYLVVRSLNVGDDTDKAMTEVTSQYLRHWVREDGQQVAGHKQRWKMLQNRITPASDAAHRILTRLLDLDAQEAPARAA